MARRKSRDSVEDLIPEKPGLSSLKEAAADCRACDLWKRGTQTVFGEGGRRAKVMFIGEQPGNEEDLQGKPFVGPAGRLLDEALEQALWLQFILPQSFGRLTKRLVEPKCAALSMT